MEMFEKGTLLKVCLIILFTLGFLLFLAPVFSNSINIGNTVGMAICSFFIAMTLFYRQLHLLLERIYANTFGRIILIAIGIIIILLLVLAMFFSVKMIMASHKYPDKPTTLIILGCKVRGEKPSPMLEARVEAAADYLLENPDINVIVSGGQGEDEKISEAQCMKSLLIEKGISSDRIVLEDKSTSTDENILFSMKLIDELDLEKNITIVTNEFHQYRTSLIAQKYGIENINCISSRTLLYLLPTYWIREWFGLCYEVVFG